MPKRYTITAALPYANGPVHIGHLAGVYVPADIFVRYLRLKKEDVVFVCGSDEHGVAITIKAHQKGVTPQVLVNEYHEMIKQSFEEFGIDFDVYSRTSSKQHHDTATAYFNDLNEKDIFVQKETEQFYDEEKEQFLADRYIRGTCPKCGYDDAYGDQCESCGSTLSPMELINPRSALSKNTPIRKKTTHWFLPLDRYEKWLQEWILEGHKDDWKSNVYGQCKSWIDNGLNPRAVTRDLKWGVPVPLKEAEGKVLYVWFDAPLGYISATKEWAEAQNKDWKPYWQDEDTELIHFIGKDNIVFHCVIFPIMLKAHGDYILPQNVPANEFLNLESNKISTSRNWAVWLHEYLKEFPGKQDVLRYTLCANMPETKDNDFTWKDFQSRNNNELVAIFGNFINRAVVLTHKYFDGVIPEPEEHFDPENELIQKVKNVPDIIGERLEHYKFREALFTMMDLARSGNKYLADTEPWHLIKTNPGRVKTILNLALQVAANLSILAEPFIPFAANKLRDILNIKTQYWEDAGNPEILPSGHQINKASLLFEKIDDSTVKYQVEKLLETKKQNEKEKAAEEDEKPLVAFEDFSKLDIRTGTITAAEKVPKTKKLLQLKVDIGTESRTVVSGIAESYNPEDIINQQVCLLANLAPRKIKGIESEGMILMAEQEDGSLAFLQPDKITANGGKIS